MKILKFPLLPLSLSCFLVWMELSRTVCGSNIFCSMSSPKFTSVAFLLVLVYYHNCAAIKLNLTKRPSSINGSVCALVISIWCVFVLNRNLFPNLKDYVFGEISRWENSVSMLLVKNQRFSPYLYFIERWLDFSRVCLLILLVYSKKSFILLKSYLNSWVLYV